VFPGAVTGLPHAFSTRVESCQAGLLGGQGAVNSNLITTYQTPGRKTTPFHPQVVEEILASATVSRTHR